MKMKSLTFLVLTLLLLIGCSTYKAPIPQSAKFDSHAQFMGRSPASLGYVDVDPAQKRIVVLKNSVKSPEDFADYVGKRFQSTRGHVYKHALKGFSMSLPDQAVQQLLKNNQIAYIVNDKPKKISAQSVPTGILRSGADKNLTAAIGGDGGNVDVDVAVIDTGVDLDHPDINVFRSVNFAKGKSANDGNGHGTHVAGTIAAYDNDLGVVGMAPGARIWAIRVLDNRGSGWTSDIVAGIDYVTQHASEIEVVNMSLGGSGSDDQNCGQTNNDPEHQAICNAVQAGVVFVVAAGNESDDSKNHTPAAYDEVITVSALADSDGQPGGQGAATSYGADDTLASFSNFGDDVDIAAPGVDIHSTWKDATYNTISGTSMASPHVAGAVALYIAKNGRANNQQEVEAIKAGVLAVAYDQSSAEGFSGDPDGVAEPLLNAEGIDPSGPPAPAVKVALSSDKDAYRLDQGDVQALITAIVKDENGNAITGLGIGSFSSSVNGSSSPIDFQEVTNGTYQGPLALGNDGSYTVVTTVTDGRSLSGNGQTLYTVSSTAAPTMHVGYVSYATTGGKNADRNLLITISIEDNSNQAVDGANVAIELYRDGSFVGSGSGLTGLDGTIVFNLRNASSGCYSSTISDVSKPGLDYDPSQNYSDPGFCK